MLPSPSEQSRRLNSEITHLLLPSVEQASLVGFLENIPRGLDDLLLGGGGVLAAKSFGIEVFEDGSEIAFGERFDFRSVELRSGSYISSYHSVYEAMTHRRLLEHDANPRIEKVLDEDGVVGVVGFEESGEERGDFFSSRTEIDRFTYVDIISANFEKRRETAERRSRSLGMRRGRD